VRKIGHKQTVSLAQSWSFEWQLNSETCRIDRMFPRSDGYQYGREEWLAEAEMRQQDRENRSKQMQEAQETALDDLSQITSELSGY